MLRLYLYLNSLEPEWLDIKMTSEELAKEMNSTAVSVRKDLNSIGCRAEGWGYPLGSLTRQLRIKLLPDSVVKAGLCGLEPWGTILLNNSNLLPGIEIVAGFDSSMNRLERTSAKVPLFPAYEITEIFGREKILFGIISSGGENAQKIADRMIKGGTLAILNMTPCPIRVPEDVFTYQADFQSGILKLLSLMSGTFNT